MFLRNEPFFIHYTESFSSLYFFLKPKTSSPTDFISPYNIMFTQSDP